MARRGCTQSVISRSPVSGSECSARASACVTRSILSNRGDAIVKAARMKELHTLRVEGVRGDITRCTDAADRAAFALAVLLDGLIPAVRALRRERPSVAVWNRYVSVSDAVGLGVP